MKLAQISRKNTAMGQTAAPEKNQGQTLLQDKSPEKSCGVCQAKDGVTFTAFYPEAILVKIAGDFNNWQPDQTAMKKIDKNGHWRIKLPLKAGTYRYRYVVDGHWHQDPYNDEAEPNSFGEFNSVIRVH